MFTLVWKVVSPWINETTRQKVKIVGSDYKKELLKVSAYDLACNVVYLLLYLLRLGHSWC